MEKINIKRNSDNDLKYLNGIAASVGIPSEFLTSDSPEFIDGINLKTEKLKEKNKSLNELNESADDILEYFTE